MHGLNSVCNRKHCSYVFSPEHHGAAVTNWHGVPAQHDIHLCYSEGLNTSGSRESAHTASAMIVALCGKPTDGKVVVTSGDVCVAALCALHPSSVAAASKILDGLFRKVCDVARVASLHVDPAIPPDSYHHRHRIMHNSCWRRHCSEN